MLLGIQLVAGHVQTQLYIGLLTDGLIITIFYWFFLSSLASPQMDGDLNASGQISLSCINKSLNLIH